MVRADATGRGTSRRGLPDSGTLDNSANLRPERSERQSDGQVYNLTDSNDGTASKQRRAKASMSTSLIQVSSGERTAG